MTRFRSRWDGTPHICVDGARSCPAEDVGGARGYANFLEAIADPGHDEHESMLEWAGGGFDPESFDVESVNKVLVSLA